MTSREAMKHGNNESSRCTPTNLGFPTPPPHSMGERTQKKRYSCIRKYTQGSRAEHTNKQRDERQHCATVFLLEEEEQQQDKERAKDRKTSRARGRERRCTTRKKREAGSTACGAGRNASSFNKKDTRMDSPSSKMVPMVRPAAAEADVPCHEGPWSSASTKK